MNRSFAQKILAFNRSLDIGNAQLPDGISVMNPFRDGNAELINRIMEEFYSKYYNDNKVRRAIMGINPGRHGAGATGIPFSDTRRLQAECGIEVPELDTRELSSVFVYDVINAYGGVEIFYSDFFISSLCPLGFLRKKENGREVNYNFYDDPALTEAVEPFIIKTLRQQIEFGLDTRVLYLMGSGKNYKYFSRLNAGHSFFEKVVALDHPRFIMQYRTKKKDEYIEKYLNALTG